MSKFIFGIFYEMLRFFYKVKILKIHFIENNYARFVCLSLMIETNVVKWRLLPQLL